MSGKVNLYITSCPWGQEDGKKIHFIWIGSLLGNGEMQGQNELHVT